MTPTTLPPGLMLVHGNHPESLRDLLVTWVRRYPLAPLETETLLVHSNGVAQWLRLALAEDMDDGAGGGCGIAVSTAPMTIGGADAGEDRFQGWK